MLTNLKKVVFEDSDGKFKWFDETGEFSCPYESEDEAIAAVAQYVEHLNGNLEAPDDEIQKSIVASLNLARSDGNVNMRQLMSHPIAKDFYDFVLFIESLPGSIEMTDLLNRFHDLTKKTEMHMNYALKLVG
ncbi:hypothetical protein EVB81_159 [Rhizobium phage RHph_I46]|uniref:Uncharacterized protein n=1 Tax=Rhizobium phage RHph_I1_9 TaxID=2509729 RepID=A0A7S5R9J2_9CAUD|nr:hypothetical protein PP936_gp158 [Rhizobium phage RHph_I1_9]QIG69728.1 hypothetical protein EVB81_159 [Rhizobium phage RHph_I46]QIG71009.1 hypothetical protein EVB92_159 [Rhizobium phage RHph_I9]QIG73595.1 hypothetical protein EVC04_158 [Rhizobium phage RHph_I1_9]QIG76348.1 hypothetical protein EVC25_159 [Rhizobium phage RHph_I34]